MKEKTPEEQRKDMFKVMDEAMNKFNKEQESKEEKDILEKITARRLLREKCGSRIRNIDNNMSREIEKINSENEFELKNRMESITEIPGIWKGMNFDQLRHINTAFALQSAHHDMSITLCKCSKDLEIPIPDEIETPNKFHNYILEKIKLKK